MSEPTVADIEAIIAENATLLGEAPTIAVHVLRDGRVRVYDIATGWRSKPYREYVSLAGAHWAAVESNKRAHRVAELVATGVPPGTAVRAAVEAIR